MENPHINYYENNTFSLIQDASHKLFFQLLYNTPYYNERNILYLIENELCHNIHLELGLSSIGYI